MSDSVFLSIKTKASKKDSFELLDYDNPNLVINRLNVTSSGKIICDKKNISFRNEEEIINENEFELLDIKKDEKNDQFLINFDSSVNDFDKISDLKSTFLVYKNSYPKESLETKIKYIYKLSEGDIIKVGRILIKFLVIKLNNVKNNEEITMNDNKNFVIKRNINYTSIRKNSSCTSLIINGQEVIKGSSNNLDVNTLNDEESNVGEIIKIQNKKNKNKNNVVFPRINSIIYNKNLIKNISKKICRICYGDDDNSDNPLINPCTCKGSMKFIHYQCLKNWLSSKIEASSLSSIEMPIGLSYCVNELVCELCKTKFPEFINYNGKILDLIFYKTNYDKYVIFESMKIDHKIHKKFIHILSLDNAKRIILGRANDCEISFPELSVSRYHCFLHFDTKNQNLYLEDNCSKFGSLVLIQNPELYIINKLPLKIQKRKIYINIKVVYPFKLFSCCGIFNNNKKFRTYQEQNQKFLNVKKNINIKVINGDDDNSESEVGEIEKHSYNNFNIINPIKLRKKKNLISPLKFKNIDSINQKFKNFNKRKLKINKINIYNTKDLDSQQYIKSSQLKFNSFDKDENKLNININQNVYVQNINLVSMDKSSKNKSL